MQLPIFSLPLLINLLKSFLVSKDYRSKYRDETWSRGVRKILIIRSAVSIIALLTISIFFSRR